MRWRWMFLAPLAIVGFLGLLALGGWLVQLLWNWLVPDIIGWRAITFWQALGLLALCRILFGGRGSHGWRRSGRSRLRRRLAERCERMTPEQRERVRRAIGRRLGLEPPAGEAP